MSAVQARRATSKKQNTLLAGMQPSRVPVGAVTSQQILSGRAKTEFAAQLFIASSFDV